MNMLDDIFNAGDNVDDQEDNGFRGSSLESPLSLQITIHLFFLNIQLEHLRPQRDIENNGNESDETYQLNMIDNKESDERCQIG